MYASAILSSYHVKMIQNRAQNAAKSRSGGGLGGSWTPLGASRERLGASVRRLGRVLGRLEAILGRLGAVLGRFGGRLGGIWGGYAASWCVLALPRGFWNPIFPPN